MTKMKKVEPITRDEDGTLVLNPDADALNADWLSSARLQRRADQGDEEAIKELERRGSTPLYVRADDDEDGDAEGD